MLVLVLAAHSSSLMHGRGDNRVLGCEHRPVCVEGLGSRMLSYEEAKSQGGTGGFSLGASVKVAIEPVSSGMPMSGTQPVSRHLFSHYSSNTPFPFAMLMPRPSALTCHHACDSRRGIAALSTGGDVGWVSRQRGPHHLSPW